MKLSHLMFTTVAMFSPAYADSNNCIGTYCPMTMTGDAEFDKQIAACNRHMIRLVIPMTTMVDGKPVTTRKIFEDGFEACEVIRKKWSNHRATIELKERDDNDKALIQNGK